MDRKRDFQRETSETQIRGSLNVDGRGEAEISTGLGFFDHMLMACARHGMMDLELTVTGDLHVDAHHTVEDTGLALGAALADCLGDKAGVRRFGTAFVPMDDALLRASLDLSGRAYLAYRVPIAASEAGGIPVLLFREFFRAFAGAARLTLHLDRLAGDEPHHLLEAAFKAFGRALDEATRLTPGIEGALSTKGTLG